MQTFVAMTTHLGEIFSHLLFIWERKWWLISPMGMHKSSSPSKKKNGFRYIFYNYFQLIYTYTGVNEQFILCFDRFGSEAKVVHFIGTPKPWNCKYNPQTKWIVEEEPSSGNQHLPYLVLWWQTYISDVLPLLTKQQVPDIPENKVNVISNLTSISAEGSHTLCLRYTESLGRKGVWSHHYHHHHCCGELRTWILPPTSLSVLPCLLPSYCSALHHNSSSFPRCHPSTMFFSCLSVRTLTGWWCSLSQGIESKYKLVLTRPPDVGDGQENVVATDALCCS